MKKLTYYFDDNTEITLDVLEYLDDAKSIIVQDFGYDQILKDYLENIYPSESEENKNIVLEYGFDGTEEAIEDMDEQDKENLASEVLFDLIYHTDVYEDYLTDSFYSEALDKYESL